MKSLFFLSPFKNLLKSFAEWLRKNRGKGWADKLEIWVDEFHRRVDNVNFDIHDNGESRALKIIASTHPTLIFDVGANNGDWCNTMHALSPESKIHCFEPVPNTYEMLKNKTRELSNITINAFGLSDADNKSQMFIGSDSLASSACKIEGLPQHDHYYQQTIDVEFMSGVSYLQKENLASPDFLKIDVEGMDFRVIKGFGDKIDDVKIIQFEYGIFNIGSRDLLIDFYNYLLPKGFELGKIYPHHVDFKRGFDYRMENFHGANYLAVKSSERELIQALSGR